MSKRALLVHGVGMTLLTILSAETLFLSFATAAAYGYPMPFITSVVEQEGSTTITTYRGDLPYFIGLGILASASLSYGLRRVSRSAGKGYMYGIVVVIVAAAVIAIIGFGVLCGLCALQCGGKFDVCDYYYMSIVRIVCVCP